MISRAKTWASLWMTTAVMRVVDVLSVILHTLATDTVIHLAGTTRRHAGRTVVSVVIVVVVVVVVVVVRGVWYRSGFACVFTRCMHVVRPLCAPCALLCAVLCACCFGMHALTSNLDILASAICTPGMVP